MKQTPKEAGTRPLLFPAPKNSPALAAAALASYPMAYLYVRNILFAAPFDGPATRWGKKLMYSASKNQFFCSLMLPRYRSMT